MHMYVQKGYTVCTEGVYNRSASLYIDIYIEIEIYIYGWGGNDSYIAGYIYEVFSLFRFNKRLCGGRRRG